MICRRRPAAAVIAYITSQQKCRGKKSRSSWVNPLDYEGIMVVNKPLILPAISWGWRMDPENDAIFEAGDMFSKAHHFWYLC